MYIKKPSKHIVFAVAGMSSYKVSHTLQDASVQIGHRCDGGPIGRHGLSNIIAILVISLIGYTVKTPNDIFLRSNA